MNFRLPANVVRKGHNDYIVPKCSGSAEQGFSMTVIIFLGPIHPRTKAVIVQM